MRMGNSQTMQILTSSVHLVLVLISAAGGPCSAATASGAAMDRIVTEAFFNGIKSKAAGSQCAGTSFYTRQAFLDAAGSFPGFGNASSSGAVDDSKREVAAFFAHATYETGHLCYIEEINKGDVFCDGSSKRWPCYPGKRYYGRGPMMLSWNFNYGPAGESIGVDLLRRPETAAKDPAVAFKTGLWLWMDRAHQAMAQGFGATIRAIYGGLHCDGRNTAATNALVGYYRDYCRQLGVGPGNNVTC